MQQIKDINEASYHSLYNLARTTWCKYAFSRYLKCDILMNNLSESFNSTILVDKDKRVITMGEWIRIYLMNRFATLRDKLKNYKGEVMPKPMKRLDWVVEKFGNWVVAWGGDGDFKVTHLHYGEKFIIGINNKVVHVTFGDWLECLANMQWLPYSS